MRVVVGGVGGGGVGGCVVPVGVDVVVRLRRASVLVAACAASIAVGCLLATVGVALTPSTHGPYPLSPDEGSFFVHVVFVLVCSTGLPGLVSLLAHHEGRKFTGHEEGRRRFEVATWLWLVGAGLSVLLLLALLVGDLGLAA